LPNSLLKNVKNLEEDRALVPPSRITPRTDDDLLNRLLSQKRLYNQDNAAIVQDSDNPLN
jgi:hypothetical protein